MLYQFSGIEFKHIAAHTGLQDKHSLGNEVADLLANQAIGYVPCKINSKKIYLNVSYAQKDIAKSFGAKWDPKKKKWYSLCDNPNLKELQNLFKI